MIGIDIVKINRITRILEKHGDAFLKKIFSKREIEEGDSRNHLKSNFLAKRFAAKEAYIKACSSPVKMREIEIRNDPSGQPILFIGDSKIDSVFVSLTDDGDYAIAVVIILNVLHSKF